MIKKIVSNALLKVFMDKRARDTLHASKKPATAGAPDPARVRQADGDKLENLNQDEVTELIRASLDQAEREIIDRKTRKASNPERQALIDQALAIHRAKRHVVDELPADQREKLMFMALKTLGSTTENGGKN